MRDLFRKIIAVTTIMIVALASMMQFHHHGCDGTVFIPIYSIDELAIHDGNCDLHGARHCMEHAHQAGHSHRHDDGRCSLHIDETVNIVRASIDAPAIIDMCLFNAISYDAGIPTTAVNVPEVLRYDIKHSQDVLLHPCGFRGPPAV